MVEKVEDIIKEINDLREKKAKENGSDSVYTTKSKQDEIKVMKAMLNDTSYKVTVYDNGGPKGEFCPAEVFKETVATIMSTAAGISKTEAISLMQDYNVSNKEASGMIELSKEFIQTYSKTGRKLHLGGRKDSNVSLIRKEIPARIMTYPIKEYIDDNGNTICSAGEANVPAYSTIRALGRCPVWVQ